jgi:hypothetical protein
LNPGTEIFESDFKKLSLSQITRKRKVDNLEVREIEEKYVQECAKKN